MEKHDNHVHVDTEFSEYLKFAGIVIALLFAAGGIAVFLNEGLMRYMELFMGLFLLTISLLKVINLESFVSAFRRYDVLAKVSKTYSYFFPFVELLLGVSFVIGATTNYILIITILLMIVSSIGVIQVLLRNEHSIMCACMGTAIRLPVTTITLIETVGMGIMATILLLF